jgi:hypothetical protein
MKTAESSKTFVLINHITRCHNQEESSLHFHNCKIVLFFSQPMCLQFLLGQTTSCLLSTAVDHWPFSRHLACIDLTHCVLMLHFYPEIGGNILLRNASVSLIPLIGVRRQRDIMWKFVIANTVNKIGVNLTLKCFCAIIVFVESITYSKCVSVAFVVEHAVRMRRICHLWRIRFYHILLHYLRKGKKFGVKLLDIKCVFWFPLQILSETFLILRRIRKISS